MLFAGAGVFACPRQLGFYGGRRVPFHMVGRQESSSPHGANDEATLLKLDNNETVSRALPEERGLAEAVKVAGYWDGIGEHSNTWKRADGTREWRLREVFINENPKHQASGSTGACSRPACWLPRPVLCAAAARSFCEWTYRYTQGTYVFQRCS